MNIVHLILNATRQHKIKVHKNIYLLPIYILQQFF
jgi:hypothetical protein